MYCGGGGGGAGAASINRAPQFSQNIASGTLTWPQFTHLFSPAIEAPIGAAGGGGAAGGALRKSKPQLSQNIAPGVAGVLQLGQITLMILLSYPIESLAVNFFVAYRIF